MPSSPPAISPSPSSSSKQGVRFAESADPSELVPLGYALRQKKQREEKAQFLRQQQEQRALEDERRKMEDERRKMEAERAEWARERAQREAEKRKLEDERRQRKIAEDYAAARKRHIVRLDESSDGFVMHGSRGQAALEATEECR